MFNSKIYAIFALALVFASAAPAQAGWDGWQWMSLNEKARQHSTVAPERGYEAFGYVRDRGTKNQHAGPQPASCYDWPYRPSSRSLIFNSTQGNRVKDSCGEPKMRFAPEAEREEG